MQPQPHTSPPPPPPPRYVKIAYHGFRALSREERMATYNDSGGGVGGWGGREWGGGGCPGGSVVAGAGRVG